MISYYHIKFLYYICTQKKASAKIYLLQLERAKIIHFCVNLLRTY